MIVVLSPSKSMDMEPAKVDNFTQPEFHDRSKKLITRLRRFSTIELVEFMEISPKLAELNRQRFKTWEAPFALGDAKQAMFAFTGDVYEGLDSTTLKKGDRDFAQSHLRILSGLYGLLRPLDLIQPYRLEMGRPLTTRGAKNLYEFWQKTVTAELNRVDDNLLVNLASQEYFKAVDSKQLKAPVVSPVFKDEKNGTYKIISFYAKKARGVMARYIMQQRVTEAIGLLDFAENGYRYNAEMSTPSKPVFTRPEKAG
jgi:cytoplasmic iron level regulating protein YaaA (DUF328/UPF0246 family)